MKGLKIYQTGTPDGEKWAQSLYEETKDNAEYLIIYASESEFASFSFDGIENRYFTLAIENQGDSAGRDFLQDFYENCVDE